MEELFARGCVVVSLAGRDKGRMLAVLDAGEDGIQVADGRQRRLEAPKRKNPRHLASAGGSLNDTAMATNRELRRALAAFAEGQGGTRRPGESLEGG